MSAINLLAMIVFRVGAQDAPVIASQLDVATPVQLRDLLNFSASVSILKDGVPIDAFRLDTFSPPVPQHSRAEHLKRHNRIRFGRDHKLIEECIAKFYDS